MAPAQPQASTPPQSEGPYFKSGSPERQQLREEGTAATPLLITGRVLTGTGEPIPGAKLDFWQADENGAYDNRGYRYRGHQFSGADGSYLLETVLPRFYSGRTRHIHVKVDVAGMRPLTTQLYFPGEADNSTDPVFDNRLLLKDLHRLEDGLEGSFDFVLGPI
jgi:protocatechuate 3,4-dioxygenase beta subunit